jgi:LacI family transcriptional regulator
MNAAENRRRRRPRVLLAVEAFRAYGRQIAEGVTAWLGRHDPWDVIFERRARVLTPDLLDRHTPLSGIIAEAGRSPAALRRRKNLPPIVYVEQTLADWPQVYPDDVEIGRMGAEYLRGLGLRSLAYLGHSGIPYSDSRREGMRQVARKEGLRFEEAPFSVRDPQRPAKLIDWLHRLPRPTGLLVIHNDPARAVMELCHNEGIRVPDHLAVLAVENDEVFCDLCIPPLSAIDHNTRRIGYEAASMLDQLMKGQTPDPTRLAVPPKGVEQRTSTEVVAAENPLVVRAVRYVQEHLGEELTAREVLRRIPAARRTIEQAFRRHLDCSIGQYINRSRVDRARQLLTDTTFSSTQIAVRCGFSSAAQFARVFKRLTGTTPVAYRKEHSLRA